MPHRKNKSSYNHVYMNEFLKILQEENIVNTVGMGDSLTGGFLMNYLRSSDSVDSFKFASCCTSATAHSKGLATREKIDSFYEKTEIKQIKNIEEVDE